MKTLFLIFFVFSNFQVFAEEKRYKIGDRGPSDGWIFYENPNYEKDGWRYLEAASYDLGRSVWSNIEKVVVGVTDRKIGAGKSNTKKIIEQVGHTNSAAKLCDDMSVIYDGKVFDDWFLPSLYELDLLCENLIGNLKTSLKYDYYWSSSESSYDNQAISSNFNGRKSWAGFEKFFKAHVRCVRAF